MTAHSPTQQRQCVEMGGEDTMPWQDDGPATASDTHHFAGRLAECERLGDVAEVQRPHVEDVARRLLVARVRAHERLKR
jgi:hypothetical protein